MRSTRWCVRLRQIAFVRGKRPNLHFWADLECFSGPHFQASLNRATDHKVRVSPISSVDCGLIRESPEADPWKRRWRRPRGRSQPSIAVWNSWLPSHAVRWLRQGVGRACLTSEREPRAESKLHHKSQDLARADLPSTITHRRAGLGGRCERRKDASEAGQQHIFHRRVLDSCEQTFSRGLQIGTWHY